MFILGLTGPSGAGKSLAARHLEQRGFYHIDADLAARAVMEPGRECLKALAAAFGGEIIREDGVLDRKRLAQLAFAGGRVAELNAVTHPFILKEIEGQLRAAEQTGARYTVLDAPALYESGADSICDKVLAVTADRALRVARIIERDGITKEQAETRVNAQPDERFYTDRADYIIRSDGGQAELFPAVDRIADRICSGGNDG